MNNLVTRTKTYLLPSLIDQYILNKENIESLYLGINGVKPQTRTSVFLLVKDDSKFKDYLNKFEYSKDVLLEYEFKNEDLFDSYMSGKFSEFKSKEKTRIINHYKLSTKDKVFQILYKSPILRTQMERELNMNLKNYELGEIVNFKTECYDTELSRD